jgi:4-amino-4-deoxy-L-arabinose transferase-like glycosyltransferase
MKESVSNHRTRYVTVLLAGLLGLLVFSIVLLSLVPPVSKDELVHHLAVPKLYLKHGGMIEIPFMPFSYYPMNLDLLYLIPLYFGNDIVPKFIHFGFALLTAWVMSRYIKRRANRTYALFGALFFLSIPLIVKLSITAYIDLGVIFFSATALLFLVEWVERGFKMKFLVLAAVFCGLGLGTKYNGLITLFLLTLFVPFLYVRAGEDRKPRLLKPAWQSLIFLLVSLTVFSPWMIRNYLWTKNPIYPLYNDWFNPPRAGVEPSATDGSEREESGGSHGIFAYRRAIYGEQGWQIALLPLRIFFQGKDGDPQYFDGRLNILLLLLPAFAFFRSREDSLNTRREMKILLAFSLLFFAFAFFSTDLRMRYIAPILPPLTILSVFGLRNLMSRIQDSGAKAARWGVIALGLSLAFFMSLNLRYLVTQFAHVDPFGYLGGKTNRHEYIARFNPEYGAVRYINQHLPEDARVSLIFLGNRGYYLDRAYVYGEDTLYRLIKGAGGPDRILRGLRAAKVTHLFIQERIFSKWLDFNFNGQEKAALHDFFKNYTEPVFHDNGFSVLSLKEVIA